MIELRKEWYQKAERLAADSRCCHVYPDSILQGVQSGNILVQSEEHMESALFWHNCGFGYLMGNPSEEFLYEIAELIAQKKGNYDRRCALQINNPEWDAFFSGMDGITRQEQYEFIYDYESPKCEYTLNDGFILKEMDQSLLDRLEGRIIPSFSWTSKKEFLERGKGFCILDGEKIAASVFTGAVSETEIDIGIETNAEYRKMGLAKLLAAHMVDYVKNQGKAPVWECNTNNLGSKAVAESVGFKIISKHPIFMRASVVPKRIKV